MNPEPVSLDRLYQETCASIRATDDISFKLMGIVPLVSGATLLTFFLKESDLSTKEPLVLALSLYAAMMTLGLFRWELQNIQTCAWLRCRAEALEKKLVMTTGAPAQPPPPQRIGKTEAEKWIYSITILSWLSIPPLVCPCDKLDYRFTAYIAAATLLLVATAFSVLAATHHG